MQLSLDLFALVLLAALLHAVWNAFVKVSGDRLLLLLGVNVTGAAAGAALLVFAAPPAAASWPFLALSAALHAGYFALLVGAYRFGDLSHVYPLARGVAPLLVAAGAALAAGERLPAAALAGVTLASAGVASLTFEHGVPWRRGGRSVPLALATGLAIAAYTVVDGLGVRRAESAGGYIGWLFVLDGLVLLAFVAARRPGAEIGRFLRREWRTCLGSGLASIVAYGLVIYAMSRGAMAAISALRETSVIFAALIGIGLLGERARGRRRVGAAVAVAAGVAIMHLGLARGDTRESAPLACVAAAATSVATCAGPDPWSPRCERSLFV